MRIMNGCGDIVKMSQWVDMTHTVTVRGDLIRNYKRIQLYNDQLTTVGVAPSSFFFVFFSFLFQIELNIEMQVSS